jgi:hypothetical protein
MLIERISFEYLDLDIVVSTASFVERFLAHVSRGGAYRFFRKWKVSVVVGDFLQACPVVVSEIWRNHGYY